MLKIIQKLNYKIIYFLLVFVFCVLFYSYITKDSFDVRISIKQENITAKDMDNIFGINLSKEYLNFKNIKKLYTISGFGYCNIYIKFNIFSNKFSNIQISKIILDDVLSRTNLKPEIDFDFEFDKKYNAFLFLYSDKIPDSDLEKYKNIIFDKLKNLKIISKILDFQKYETIDYIYFKNSDLISYNITPSELKTLVQQNNLLKNSSSQENNNFYNINYSSGIKSTSDIENIVLYYQDKNFSNQFKNIFKIKRKLKSPTDYSVLYGNKKAILLVLSKNNFIPCFIFDLLIKNQLKKIDLPYFVKYKFKNTKNLSKIEIVLNDNSSEKDLLKIANNINDKFKNQIYFLKIDTPKISTNDIFFEANKNKIVVLTDKKSKIINYLKDNKINFKKQNTVSKKEKTIFYNFNPIDINAYYIDKEQVIDNINANNDGLVCDYYFDNSKRIKIILKNQENSNLIYLNKYKNFIDVYALVKKELKEDYTIIVRKNGNQI